MTNFEEQLSDLFAVEGAGIPAPDGDPRLTRARAQRRTRNHRIGSAGMTLGVFAIAAMTLPGLVQDRPTTIEVADQPDVGVVSPELDDTLQIDPVTEDRPGLDVEAELDADGNLGTDTDPESDGETGSDENGAGSDSGQQDASDNESDTATSTAAPKNSDLLTESDFSYLGAFRTPAGEVGSSEFSYGGRSAAFNPNGDSGGSGDGFSGSMFMTGHVYEQHVAEISIPAPAKHSGSSANLPVAKVLQSFADITGGRAKANVGGRTNGDDGFRIGGLEVANVGGEPRLHWTAWEWNNNSGTQHPGHGHSSLDVSKPQVQGPWYLENFHNNETAGYIFEAPADFANSYLDGHELITGFQAEASNSTRSWGPPFFAYSANTSGSVGSRLDAMELVNYSYPDDTLSGHDPEDLSPGAEWIQASAGEAIITVGNKLVSEKGRGVDVTDGCDPKDSEAAGAFQPQIRFYDPNDLAQAAAGTLAPEDVKPYRSWNPERYLLPTCSALLSSASFDAKSGRLYVVQPGADKEQNQFEPVPVVHVFEIR